MHATNLEVGFTFMRSGNALSALPCIDYICYKITQVYILSQCSTLQFTAMSQDAPLCIELAECNFFFFNVNKIKHFDAKQQCTAAHVHNVQWYTCVMRIITHTCVRIPPLACWCIGVICVAINAWACC